MDNLRIGVIGLNFGQHHVRTLANIDDAQLVAIAELAEGFHIHAGLAPLGAGVTN